MTRTFSAANCGSSHVAQACFSSGRSGPLRLESARIELISDSQPVGSAWVAAVAKGLSVSVTPDRRGRRTTIGIPGHSTLTKWLKVPRVAAAKQGKIVEFEAAQNVPYPLKEAVWDYLPATESGGNVDILLAAIRREVVDELCDSVARSGCQVQRVLPSAVALIYAYRYLHPTSKGTVVVMNVGARSTHIIAIGGPRFHTRTVAIAGNSVTQSIADELGVPFETAESYKRIAGETAVPNALDARTTLAVSNATDAFASRIQLEVMRALASYQRQLEGEPVRTLMVTGGGSLLPRFEELLATKLGYSVGRLDPTSHVEFAEGTAEYFKSAYRRAALVDLLGLAAAQREKTWPDFTLLPPEMLQILRFKKRQPLLAGAAALIALSFLPVIGLHARELKQSRQQVERLSAEIKDLDAFKKRNQESVRKLEQLRLDQQALERLAQTKSSWAGLLSDLQEAVEAGGNVWLDQLQWVKANSSDRGLQDRASNEGKPSQKKPSAGRLSVSGCLLAETSALASGGDDSEKRVRALFAEFKRSKFIASIEHERFDRSQRGVLKFTVVLVLDSQVQL